MLAAFSRKQNEKTFFGKQRLANSKQICVILAYFWASLKSDRMLMKLNSEFFAKHYMRRQLFTWQKKFGEIDLKCYQSRLLLCFSK